MSSVYVPRWYQEEAEYSIFEYFQQGGEGNPLIAMPTGTGKSIVIANFIRRVFSNWPGQRVMMLTHVKKLISQNSEKLTSIWPTAPIGIYSAGLSSRETIMPIIFAGVQSVAPAIKRAVVRGQSHFGHRDLLLIDEAHLLSSGENTQYQYVIAELKKINPFLKVIGFTATPYRLKQGLLIDEDGLFTNICYDLTGVEPFNRLIAEGWLSPLISRPTVNCVDTSAIGICAGEFNSKDAESEAEKVAWAGIQEFCQMAHDRNHWLIFAAGIKNAENLTGMLNALGVSAACSHSKLSDKENDARIKAFESGEIRALVGMNKYTTGYDFPPIDAIADFQPTCSPGKHVQKAGRGTRPSPQTNKQNCLFADFASNTKRLGPINDPVIPRKGGKGTGDAPIRICESCGVYNHASARVCINCGVEFKFKVKIFQNAFAGEIIKGDAPVIEYFNVSKVIYNLHEKKDENGNLIKPPMIKVSYFCGLKMFSEYVTLEHSGFAARRAKEWWRLRHKEEPPPTTYEALKRVSELRVPSKIKVLINKKYPEILSVEW